MAANFRAEQVRLPDVHPTAIRVLVLTAEDGSDDHVGTLKAAPLIKETVRRRRTFESHPDGANAQLSGR
jgi:hypothetical protein